VLSQKSERHRLVGAASCLQRAPQPRLRKALTLQRGNFSSASHFTTVHELASDESSGPRVLHRSSNLNQSPGTRPVRSAFDRGVQWAGSAQVLATHRETAKDSRAKGAAKDEARTQKWSTLLSPHDDGWH
jgi:hypothetical protein